MVHVFFGCFVLSKDSLFNKVHRNYIILYCKRFRWIDKGWLEPDSIHNHIDSSFLHSMCLR